MVWQANGMKKYGYQIQVYHYHIFIYLKTEIWTKMLMNIKAAAQ